MDIQEFSDATIEKFVDRGFIKQFADFLPFHGIRMKLSRWKDSEKNPIRNW